MIDVAVTITLPDGIYRKNNLKQLETYEETLGVWDNPLGGNEEHFKVVRKKMELWINHMKNGQLQSHIAWLGYRL